MNNEKYLIVDLREIRLALQLFKHDTGVCPIQLNDLCADNENDLKSKIVKGTYKGPYIAHIPPNPLFEEKYQNAAETWIYDNKNGIITSGIKGNSYTGKPYRDY
jgi:hypothetical protein